VRLVFTRVVRGEYPDRGRVDAVLLLVGLQRPLANQLRPSVDLVGLGSASLFEAHYVLAQRSLLC
jgi:hypothetical protein